MRRIAIAIKWIVIIGVTAGTVSRLVMRAIARLSEAAPAFSWSGTLGIVLFFVLAMLPGAVMAAFTRSRWRWVVMGMPTALLALGGVGIASTVVEDAPDSLPAIQWIGIWTGTAFILLVVGAQAVLVIRQIDREVARKVNGSVTSGIVQSNAVSRP